MRNLMRNLCLTAILAILLCGIASAADYIDTPRGICIVNQEVEGTITLEDYDLYSRLVDLNDESALAAMRGTYRIVILHKGQQVEILSRRTGTNAIEVRPVGGLHGVWIPIGCLEK